MEKILHSYYMMFNIIVIAFQHGCGELDEALPPLCGVIDPENPYFGGPADLAIYNDWKKYVTGKHIDESNILENTIKFCKKLDWEIDNTIHFLESSFTKEMIKSAIVNSEGKGIV